MWQYGLLSGPGLVRREAVASAERGEAYVGYLLEGAPRVLWEQQRLLQVKRDLAYARQLHAAEVARTRDAQVCRDFEYALQLQFAEDAAAAVCQSPTGAAAEPAHTVEDE